jgi:Lon protease-like protein
VLFPGSLLPLKIFEQRYLDMTAACMKQRSPFGICLIDKGSEVGAAAQPHAVGTLATIGNWEMEQLGILMITAHGGRRFRIIESTVGEGNLLEASVELLAEIGPTPCPGTRTPAAAAPPGGRGSWQGTSARATPLRRSRMGRLPDD